MAESSDVTHSPLTYGPQRNAAYGMTHSETHTIEVVAINVRRARVAAGLSQEALANEAGLDRTYVSQVERAKRNLTIVVLARLAFALGTTPDRLLIPTSTSNVERRSAKNTRGHRGRRRD